MSAGKQKLPVKNSFVETITSFCQRHTVRLLSARKIATVEYECRQHDEVVFAGNAKLLTRS